ncbi:leucine rich repeat protein [Ichthyophthirius multifiliis]|uniref:Leucine rich repeat protein n=1 Tax=Ichthyophthirius multifiliis TaxID=5932 RepID=G0R202_ICHMU|nr:leucine rich repeat protein [Ichthyophthirius multifiliis]EGR28501.1 leucine rich repeat protein [Ichthyophthirius multifiliis]|eukprot:XP_004029737.1 leucine rich repeat protein [Ichthyophthirius multifiliis]
MSTIRKPNKQMYDFHTLFWKKIEEELRIFTLLEKRPKRELPLYELRPDDLNIDLQKVKQWSEQTEQIYNQLLENGYADFICNKEYLREVFLDLKFNRQYINCMDKELLNLKNLKILELNQNLITTIENIPPQLLELHLFQNHISQISIQMKPSKSLLFLGLGFNKLNDNQITNIPKFFPNLVCLDISNNLLEDIQNLLSVVCNLSSLKMLCAYGNPICLLSNYKKGLIHALINLEYLDNEKIIKGEIIEDEKIQQQIQEIPEESQLDEAANTQILQNQIQQYSGKSQKQIKIRFKIDTLENLPEGIVLDKQAFPKAEQFPEQFQTQAKFEIPSEIPEINHNLTGKAISEEICKDEDYFRLDMKVDFIEEFPVNIQTKEMLNKGIICRIYKTEPLMENIENQEEKQVKIDPQTGFPEESTAFVGLFRLDLQKWNSDGNMPKVLKYKYPIFEENILKVPEFFFPIENEQKLIKKNAEKINLMLKQQEESEKPIETEVLDPKKKDNKKKEVKKQDKKPQKKTGKDEEKPRVVPISSFPVFQRQQVFVDVDNIYLSLRKWLVAAQMEIVQ